MKNPKKLYRAEVTVVVYYLSDEDSCEEDALQFATEELRGNCGYGIKPRITRVKRTHKPTDQWNDYCLPYGSDDIVSNDYDGEIDLGEAIDRFGA
jgi:hypothetical protein